MVFIIVDSKLIEKFYRFKRANFNRLSFISKSENSLIVFSSTFSLRLVYKSWVHAYISIIELVITCFLFGDIFIIEIENLSFDKTFKNPSS